VFFSFAQEKQEIPGVSGKVEVVNGGKEQPKCAFEYVSLELVTTDRKALDKCRVLVVRNENKIFSIDYSSDFAVVTVKFIATLGKEKVKSILVDQGILFTEEIPNLKTNKDGG
jgi:hypothetical protein